MATREELVAALSMGPAPQQQGIADPRWQRLMQALAFDPSLFGAGGQEMPLAQGIDDPNAAFQGGGASGSWAPEAEPPGTLGEWWDQSTAFRPMAEEAVSAATLPGDVYAGRVDPASDEAIDRAAGLAGMVTLGAGAVPAKGAELGMGIRLFHGSPHDFAPEPGHPHGRFRWDKIGTGQGAQSYGVGHYGAEAEAVAKDYRDTLSKARVAFSHPELGDVSTDQLDDILLQEVYRIAPNKEKRLADMMAVNTVDALNHGDDFNAMRRWVREQGGPPEDEAAWNAVLKKAEEFKPKHTPGKMYEFEVAAEPEQFLDWDKPLSQQSETVKGALGSVPWADEYLKSGTLTGGQIAPKTSEGATQLREAGIPGIRYLDQGSRATSGGEILGAFRDGDKWTAKVRVNRPGAGPNSSEQYITTSKPYASEEEALQWARSKVDEAATRNYVIFDDNLINILRKYGMAGMIGTPLGLEMAQRLMQQEQGEVAPAL